MKYETNSPKNSQQQFEIVEKSSDTWTVNSQGYVHTNTTAIRNTKNETQILLGETL